MAERLLDPPVLPSNQDIDEMSSSNINAVLDNAGGQTAGPVLEELGKAASLRKDAETLLRALRNVVIALVRPADDKRDHDSNEIALGPGGEEFITALQKFMGSVLHSQRGSAGGIEVELDEISSASNDGGDQDTAELEPISRAVPLASTSPSENDQSFSDITDTPSDAELVRVPGRVMFESGGTQDQENINTIDERPMVLDVGSPIGRMVSNGNSEDFGDAFEKKRSQFFGLLWKKLREHVFNTMPIRLLYFRTRASKLQITLIERGEIYAHIASSLENGIDFAAVLQDVTNVMETYDGDLTFDEAIESMIRKLIRKYSGYAILSHTWIRGPTSEVTYGDWNRGEFDTQQPGYRKLVNFCKAAWNDYGVAFGWMDTICINKESSAELDESIHSMYQWYRHAHICITYLADTVVLSGMHDDTWFTRGWTLQELLAPRYMKFYNTSWSKLAESDENDKEDSVILEQIEQATTITANELQECSDGYSGNLLISRRMQMAAKRQVTREEDRAYSLMGIFDVSIPIAYGEGSTHAFSHLLQEILNSTQSGRVDIFNWGGGGTVDSSGISTLLPSSPQEYLHRSSHAELILWRKPIEPLILTHLGLRITMVLMPAMLIQNPTLQYDSIGEYHATVSISTLAISYNRLADYSKIKALDQNTYSILDARISEDDRWKTDQARSRRVLGVLNITQGDDEKILVPKHCLAVALLWLTDEFIKDDTEAPIVFTLETKPGPDGGEPANYNALWKCYSFDRNELANHGMKLTTIHL